MTFKKCPKISVQSFETLTNNCGKTVGRFKILTDASEKGTRDLFGEWYYEGILIWL